MPPARQEEEEEVSGTVSLVRYGKKSAIWAHLLGWRGRERREEEMPQSMYIQLCHSLSCIVISTTYNWFYHMSEIIPLALGRRKTLTRFFSLLARLKNSCCLLICTSVFYFSEMVNQACPFSFLFFPLILRTHFVCLQSSIVLNWGVAKIWTPDYKHCKTSDTKCIFIFVHEVYAYTAQKRLFGILNKMVVLIEKNVITRLLQMLQLQKSFEG